MCMASLLALMRFLLLQVVIGSLCRTATSFWMIVLVEPVSGRALI